MINNYLKLLCTGLIFFLISCSSDEEKSKAVKPKTQLSEKVELANKESIYFVGDSLVAGKGVEDHENFVSLLKDHYQINGSFSFVNSGLSGETSSGLLSRIDWLLAEKINILFLCTGANDGLRGLPAKKFKENLNKIILKIKSKNIKLIFAGMKLPPNYGVDYTDEFSRVYKELAEKHELLYYPFLLEGVAGIKEMNLEDGIHPNPKGHQIIAKGLIAFLKSHEFFKKESARK